MMDRVKVWAEDVIIPTYEIGEAEKNPIFLEKRVYQGSSGVVYPHPVVEKISDVKVDKIWQAVYLENQYLKIMILPELGGRVQMAYDKVKERHFVYYNQVIKPALVGLTGPWISGGIEFNWPQHHRPSTYQKVEYDIEENEDGSKTIWCNEVERMFRTKGMAGFTLHPDKAYLEIKGKLYNRTPFPQTFLWWANPAVAVNDHYQSVFPPDVHAVFDHGKRDVSEFPIAKGTYYKVDYSKGVDISKYKNIPVPTSYMAIVSEYDFVGGYENDSKGGLLHVADHHISPGKKQWTWGNGEFGQAWDRNLTDEDGPYIELMCGVFTDNQPDFSWLMPNEEKSFTQYFMPYQELGMVKKATKNALLNFEVAEGKAQLKVYATSKYKNAKIRVIKGQEVIFEKTFSLSPQNVFNENLNLGDLPAHAFKVEVKDAMGKILVAWQAPKSDGKKIPNPAKAALPPQEVESNEQLFLTGQHIEQYRHATFDPADYYLEALKRDPKDYRCNNALGLLMMKKGRFEKALSYLKAAVDTQLERNPNPYDGEPLFNLGLVYRFIGQEKGAFDAFYKSIWNAAWKDAGYLQITQLHLANGEYEEALETINQSLIRNSNSPKAQHLKVLILRKMGKQNAAQVLAQEGLEFDRFNYGLHFEKYLLTQDESSLDKIHEIIGGDIHPYLEYALDYFWAGQFQEAILMIDSAKKGVGQDYPISYYLTGWFKEKIGKSGKQDFQKAQEAPTDYCFPNRIEELLALQAAKNICPQYSNTHYYLGNFWYHNRQYDLAREAWETSVKLNPNFSIALRNLALAKYNKFKEANTALDLMEKAFNAAPEDSRILMELDQLYKKENYSLEFRLELLEKYSGLVEQRDDLYLERATLLNLTGNYEQAYESLMNRKFHPWEGGEGKVTEQYKVSLMEMAKKALLESQFDAAIDCLERSFHYPHNLGEGKLYGTLEPEIYFWLGYAHAQNGLKELANENWLKATEGDIVPSIAWYYNDQKSDRIFYQGMALRMLGKDKEAANKFEMLVNYGKQHIHDKITFDYFAVSMPDLLIWEENLNDKNILHCQFLMGLGFLGLGEKAKAEQAFTAVLDKQCSHIEANIHRQLIQNFQLMGLSLIK
ncbi:DUF5107 domain-containing protein [Echinicola jeungdonensis]|uniref:DUF5107 domain-containing protein n=1 Tax=Echinicola jeungdonensis TaxID=709343 RepID=A0ABV5J9E7_9BACT|nr:DUF5107 domain-containing protein [Echinicola jeungdonensis]MDN3670451.1 DUF5107 domain-containing protein [Echinicola jeungdonensis]